MMMDPEYEAARDAFGAWIDLWKPKLLLNQWDIEIVYHRGPISGQPNGTTATCRPAWQYMAAGMNVNVLIYAEMDARDQERTVVHELLHCVLDQATKGGKATEHAISWLVRVLVP